MNPPNNISETDSDKTLKEHFGNKMPYEVPDGYFENLPGRVLDACKSKDAKMNKTRFFTGRYKKLAAAAAILLLVTSVITIVFMNKSLDDDSLLEFSNNELYQYNVNNLFDLEEEYLLSWIENDSLGSIKLMNDNLEDISDDVIMDYLLAENYIEYHIINEY